MKPNVLLVVADCLRADSLPRRGQGDRLPNLHALLEDSCRFPRTYAASSWTKTAVASLLTATFPVTHGAYAVSSAVPAALGTLPEILRDDGYATTCITSNVYFTDRSGLERGFEKVRYFPDKDGARINGEFREELDRLRGGRFFIYLHYMDAHLPFKIRDTRFGEEYHRVIENFGRTTLRDTEALGMTEAELKLLRDLYDHEVEYLDSLVGEVVALLKARGLYEQTAVVLTADHGSEYGEHRGVYHGYSLYEESIRVPLSIKPAKGGAGAGGEVRQAVRHVDLMPTILDLLQIDAPRKIQGESLRPLMERREATEAADRLVFCELLQFPLYRLEAVLEDGWKLIRRERISYPLLLRQLWRNVREGNWYILRSAVRGGRKALTRIPAGRKGPGGPRGRRELYHLPRDPGERTNVAEREPTVAARLSEKLDLYRRDLARCFADTGRTVPHDEELKERLKALGYVD